MQCSIDSVLKNDPIAQRRAKDLTQEDVSLPRLFVLFGSSLNAKEACVLRKLATVSALESVTVNKYSFSAYFYTAKDYQAKNIIFGPPEYKNISYYRIA